MAEAEPMKIDGANEPTPEIDVPRQRKKTLKRKRLDPSLYAGSPEEKSAKVSTLRTEIDSLVKFGKDSISENREELMEIAEKIGDSSVSLNHVISCLMEESDLPLTKLVDEIFEKVKGRNGNGEIVSKATVKSTVLMIGQRLCYGVMNPDVDLLEDESESALWCWETRDLKLMPKLLRALVKVRRTCRKKIQERIITVLAMITALEKSEDNPNWVQEMKKASEKLGKVLNEADIRLLMENTSPKHGAEMADKDSKRDEKMLIKQMEKNKRDTEKERKKMDRENLQKQRELKRLHDEAEKEEKRREKEEAEMQKQLKKQQEEAEKEKKRKENEHAEIKKQLGLQKQASMMEQFLKMKKVTVISQQDSSLKKAASKLSSMDERKSEAVSLNMDSVLAQNSEVEAEALWKSHLSSWHCIGRSVRSNRKQHWGIRQKPKAELVKELKLITNRELTCDEEKLVNGWVDNVDEKSLEMNIDRPHPICQKLIRRKQLLQFDKSCRPAFYGVWPRKSQVVGARRPLAKDPEVDYEIDSDEEWEEEEPGESLSDCDEDPEDEKMEDLKGSDGEEDESEDGFFVPDGYLSENEGAKSDDMESDELVEQVRNLSDSERKLHSEDFCTLLRQQKYLNSLTEQALRKNQPLIILNLMHEKTTSLPAEEVTDLEKLELMCLNTLSIRPLPDFPSIEISIYNDIVDGYLEASPNNSSTTSLANAAALMDSDLPQIVSVIQSCSLSIGKIVNALHNKFPALPKSQLRNKVREISEFSENRWQVKKDILSKLGFSTSPGIKKAKSIASFFTKRCMPPSEKTINFSESPPQSSQKHAGNVHPQGDSLFDN